MRRSVIAILVLGLSLHAAASAQDIVEDDPRPIIIVQQPEGPPPFVNLRGFSNDYQVGAADNLDIQVVGQDDLRQTVRVSNSGEISYGMLGLIRVAGMTTFEIEEAIARRFREKGLIEHAEVLCYVTEYHAKPVYVSGAVENPGEFIMSQDLTVADAILLAGGLRFNAADEGVVHRRTSRQGHNWSPETLANTPDVQRAGIEILKVDLRPIKQGKFPQDSLPLRRGDVLVVPELRMNPFYVVGEVLSPRNYFFPPERKLMASQAISWAGGPLPTAKMSDGMLVRYDEKGERTELKVDYSAILKGKQKDFQVHANDVIFIPGSKVKTITHGMLLLTDTMVMQQAFTAGRRYRLMRMPEPPERPDQDNGQ